MRREQAMEASSCKGCSPRTAAPGPWHDGSDTATPHRRLAEDASNCGRNDSGGGRAITGLHRFLRRAPATVQRLFCKLAAWPSHDHATKGPARGLSTPGRTPPPRLFNAKGRKSTRPSSDPSAFARCPARSALPWRLKPSRRRLANGRQAATLRPPNPGSPEVERLPSDVGSCADKPPERGNRQEPVTRLHRVTGITGTP